MRKRRPEFGERVATGDRQEIATLGQHVAVAASSVVALTRSSHVLIANPCQCSDLYRMVDAVTSKGRSSSTP